VTILQRFSRWRATPSEELAILEKRLFPIAKS
jgi:hypothetical protein